MRGICKPLFILTIILRSLGSALAAESSRIGLLNLGAKPTKLFIEQPTHFLLRINGKTARELRLAISAILLISANKVME